MNKLGLFFLFILTCVSVSLAQSTNSDPTDWSGFYVGGNGFASSDKTDAAAALQINQITNLNVTGRGLVVVPGTTRDFAASRRKTNGSGGGQAGYQWQSGRFVFGAESDFNPIRRTFSVSQSFQMPPTILTPVTTVEARRDVEMSREFSIRGRGGVAFGKTLVYGTGGYSNARAKVSSIDSFTNPGGQAPPNCGAVGNPCFNSGSEGPVITTATESKSMSGWNIGAGVEHKLGKHFSIGFEYRHTDLGSKTFSLSNRTTVNTGQETRGDNGQTGGLGSVNGAPTRVSLKSDAFSVRFNFHF